MPGDHIDVVYLGVDAVRMRAIEARDELVLFVGSIFNRRNVPTLLTAFAQVAGMRPHARLEIVGNDRTHPPQNISNLVAASPAAERIRLRPWISDEELAALYARASVFTFLSEYEGMGLTPLEALAAGVPPVVLDTPVARETLGDAAVFVLDPEPRAVAEAIDALLVPSSEARRAVLAAAPASAGTLSMVRRGGRGLVHARGGGALVTRLAIIVVTHNARDDVARLLDSLTTRAALRGARDRRSWTTRPLMELWSSSDRASRSSA